MIVKGTVNLHHNNKDICEVSIQIDAPFLDFRAAVFVVSFASGAYLVVQNLLFLARNINVLIYFQDWKDIGMRRTSILMNYS